MASIKKLANGSYQATVYIGRDSSGKQLRKYITKPSLKECKTAARELEQDIEEGLYIDTGKIKFSKWADDWFEMNKNRISPSTEQTYKIYIDKHFKPYFGSLKISKINDIMIKKYMSEKLKILSPTTVRKHFYVLSEMLEDILKHKNPCKYISPPEVAQYDYHVVTDEEFKKIREFFQGKSYEIIILLAALCGMRRGEIFALKWNDIDTKNQTIKIDQALAISDEEKGYVEKGTKSKNGVRIVVAPQEVFDLLEKRHKKLLQQQCKKGKTIQERIFTSRPDTFSSHFAECMQKLNFNIRFHDLRHYHATWLYKNGIPDLFAAQRLGDNLQTIKKVYQHIGEETEKKINDEILRKIKEI